MIVRSVTIQADPQCSTVQRFEACGQLQEVWKWRLMLDGSLLRQRLRSVGGSPLALLTSDQEAQNRLLSGVPLFDWVSA